MRKVVATKHGIRTGDLVRIHVSLKRGMDFAKVSVWAAEPGIEFSPYVDPQIALITERGGPKMARPFHRALHEKAPSHVFEFVADMPMSIQLRQEVDSPDDESPKARIKTYGKTLQRLRRFLSYRFWR